MQPVIPSPVILDEWHVSPSPGPTECSGWSATCRVILFGQVVFALITVSASLSLKLTNLTTSVPFDQLANMPRTVSVHNEEDALLGSALGLTSSCGEHRSNGEHVPSRGGRVMP